MKYCVFGKGKGASKMADQVVTKMLQEYSRQLFGFTRAEFDSIVEYDVINIMAYYYSKMNAQQKAVIVNVLQEQFELSYMDDTLEKLAMFADDEVYVPLSCKLMDRLGDSRVTIIVYETIFMCCANMTKNYWNQSNSYSNYLVLLNTAFFHALSYKLHIKDSYVNSMKALYDQDGYDEFVESLYEKHLDDMDWDADVELDVLDELIDVSKTNTFFDEGTQKEYMDAVEAMGNIRREHVNTVREEDETKGFARIVEKTGICELQSVDIHGFECHFCEAKYSDEKYIIIYYDKNKADLMIEEQRRLAEERSARLVDELKKSEAERRKLEAEREKEAELRRTEAERRTQLEEELCKAEEKSRQQEEQRKADDARRQEELRKAEEARQLEEQRRAEEEKVLQEVEQQKIRYKQMNVCQYCGGVFTGLFNKKCKVCGKPKDYA